MPVLQGFFSFPKHPETGSILPRFHVVLSPHRPRGRPRSTETCTATHRSSSNTRQGTYARASRSSERALPAARRPERSPGVIRRRPMTASCAPAATATPSPSTMRARWSRSTSASSSTTRPDYPDLTAMFVHLGAGAGDLRGAQHLWRDSSLRPAGAAWRMEQCGPALAARQAVLRLALHADSDALPFSPPAAVRHGQAAHPGDRPRRPLLAATFNGRRRALTSRALLRSFFGVPLVSFKVIAATHWEALRLWLKGGGWCHDPMSQRGLAPKPPWRQAKRPPILSIANHMLRAFGSSDGGLGAPGSRSDWSS